MFKFFKKTAEEIKDKAAEKIVDMYFNDPKKSVKNSSSNSAAQPHHNYSANNISENEIKKVYQIPVKFDYLMKYHFKIWVNSQDISLDYLRKEIDVSSLESSSCLNFYSEQAANEFMNWWNDYKKLFPAIIGNNTNTLYPIPKEGFIESGYLCIVNYDDENAGYGKVGPAMDSDSFNLENFVKFRQQRDLDWVWIVKNTKEKALMLYSGYWMFKNLEDYTMFKMLQKD
jgi:hypothetical protein